MRPLRVTVGIDPGVTGAIGVLHDCAFASVHDMPLRAKRADGSGNRIDATELAKFFRHLIQSAPGAHVLAVLERVGGRPGEGGPASFQFGQGDGIIRGVLASHGIETAVVSPIVWKRHCNLIGEDKDESRTLAVRVFPAAHEFLARKKDGGRAEALLLAGWGSATEATGNRL